MKVNAAEEDFELMELFGKTVLFTNMRVDRSTVPKELYVYELRDEDCTGDICEIRPFVMVNLVNGSGIISLIDILKFSQIMGDGSHGLPDQVNVYM